MRTVTFCLGMAWALSATAADLPRQDIDPMGLQLEAPIESWDEAIPLGNGLTGGLLWGDDNVINLSLDRGDLWDERLPELYHKPNWNYATIRTLKAVGNQAEISRLFDHPYNRIPHPTKLPGGRLVLQLEPSRKAKTFALDFTQAIGRVELSTGRLECFFSAVRSVAMVRVNGQVRHRFVRPAGLDALGYEPATFGKDDGMTWMTQQAAEGLTYAVVVASKRVGDDTQLAVAITADGDDPLAIGKERVADALTAGYDAMLAPHQQWWAEFWAGSSVSVPDARIERHYNLLEDRDGTLYLPLSSSPEIHDNSLRAWLTPNSNYDLALMRWAFAALAEMATALDRTDDVAKWRGLASKLESLHVDDENVLMFAPGEPFDVSHRHHSHTMAIHPLGNLNIAGSSRDRAIIAATLDRMHEKGTQAWVGYSFSWFACLAARAGRAEQALTYLRDYERAFILRNGFHVNGDQLGAGLSAFRYRPFTLEGNFLAMEAVHEMLLQGWGGRIRVFPAVSREWPDASFNRLRAEGGFTVSAERAAGQTQSVRITATVDQPLRLVNPFGSRPYDSNRELERVGDELRCDLQAGQTLTLTVR